MLDVVGPNSRYKMALLVLEAFLLKANMKTFLFAIMELVAMFQVGLQPYFEV